jgi:hypothetical protein
MSMESNGRRALATPTDSTRVAISVGENASNPNISDMDHSLVASPRLQITPWPTVPV